MATLAVDEQRIGRGVRVRFTLAILAGSFLLFLVQPMVARMALPRLGGAPAVWNSAMLVYQALLLGGYAYAHAIGRLALRRQAAVHVALLLAAALMLPIGLIDATPSPDASPFLWTPWLLIVSMGPLFFVIAAQAPLLQRWFAASGGGDPYPLYAASNLGSFAGLLAYPLVVEPLLPLAGQSWLWSAGYLAVVALVGVCVLRLPRANVPLVDAVTSPPGWRRVATWIALAAIPSGLMLSTTTHLTTDIVAMPLLWVVPLGLYLLSFSVAFAVRRGPADAITTLAPLILLIGGGASFANNAKYPWMYAGLGLVLLFVIAVALHAALYERRPEPARLTAFYLATSVGGVLGGAFCALLAPLIFDWAYEHPLLILAAALFVPQRPLFEFVARWQANIQIALAVGLVAIVASMAAGGLIPLLPDPAPAWVAMVAVLVIIWLAILSIGQRLAYMLTLAALMLALGGWETLADTFRPGVRTRSYFGIYTIATGRDGRRFIVHGTTLHGTQDLRPGRERDTLSYYAPLSGVGLAMRALPQLTPAPRVGVVGLGSGTLACYATPGARWRFYEIDPGIARIARDPARFSFLSRCTPGVPVRIGDARLTLASEPAGTLDMLVIDAFSSDSVPMHLMTNEAFDVYRRNLTPDGLLLVHISNRFLQLEPVVAAASQLGWHASVRDYEATPDEQKAGMSSSLWVALSPDRAKLDRLVEVSGREQWRSARVRPGFAGWTDDHASILPLLKVWQR